MQSTSTAEERLYAYLARRGWELPAVPQAKGAYQTLVLQDGIAYTAGHLPINASGELITGTLAPGAKTASGEDLKQTAVDAATWCVLNILATLRNALGSLDRIENCMKMTGLIQSTADFHGQPGILNDACEMLVEIFGREAGAVARTAAGAVSLPLDAIVEIEMILKYRA